MRFLLYLFLSTVFFVCSATTCCYYEDDEQEPCRLVDIQLHTLDNSGEEPVASYGPINRNALVIGIDYLVLYSGEEYPALYTNSYYGQRNIIGNIVEGPRVYTASDFGEGYPAGSEITDLFSIPAKDIYGKHNISMILRQTPPAGEYTFVVRIRCSDRAIEKSTGRIKLI